MTNGESVQLLGFGAFEVRERAERTGHNPKTGEVVKIAACKTPVFKPGKPLKDAVNKYLGGSFRTVQGDVFLLLL